MVSGSSLEVGGGKGENLLGKLYEVRLLKVFGKGTLGMWELNG